MNFKAIRKVLGKILTIEGILMVIPLLVSFIYKEDLWHVLAFVISMVGLIACGSLMRLKTKDATPYQAKEGFMIVGLSWLLMALFGAIPFVISKDIPNYIDAFFEICSGFSTTGASIVRDVEKLAHSTLLWRSFSQWIGGMGVLVFVLAISDDTNEGSTFHLLRAESPGPQVGKLVSKMRVTARILYLIYAGLTALEVILLCIGKMDVFSSINIAMATTSTGGFGILNTSIASYGSYAQYVIAIFMFLCGINFSLFYFLLIGKAKQFFKSEELRVYLGIVILSVGLIVLNTFNLYSTFEEAFRSAFFQVASISTTTGFMTSDFNVWPAFSKTLLLLLMFIGACAGSTSGGFKLSRAIILLKSSVNRIKKTIHPEKIRPINFEGKHVEEPVSAGITAFFAIYMASFILCALLISFDGFDLITNFSASLACISNIGPGLGLVGPTGNYADFSAFSKIVLSLEMITGRLELLPIMILFSPKTWTRSRW